MGGADQRELKGLSGCSGLGSGSNAGMSDAKPEAPAMAGLARCPVASGVDPYGLCVYRPELPGVPMCDELPPA